MIIHATVATPRGEATIRDLVVDDIDDIVRYWHHSGTEHLEFLGIDCTKLGSPEDTRKRFLHAIRTNDVNQANVALAITLDQRLIGYSNLNRYGPDDNYPHLHLIDPSSRAGGVATQTVPRILKIYFQLFPVRRLILQTHTDNTGINQVLDKYFPTAETRHFDNPDGLVGAGEFHVRYVSRSDLP